MIFKYKKEIKKYLNYKINSKTLIKKLNLSTTNSNDIKKINPNGNKDTH